MLWIVVTAAVVSWLALVLLAGSGVLFDDYTFPLIIALAVTASIALVGYRVRTPSSVPRDRPTNPKLIYWAAIATFIAIAPLLSSFASSLIAANLGCSVNEHYARGCFLGTWDLNAFVHGLHLSIFAIFLTWPAALIALGLWAKVVFD